MVIKKWIDKATGEISKLRIKNWFFNINNMYSAPYSLGIEGHVDYKVMLTIRKQETFTTTEMRDIN